jgi:ElaB/YqjD/DUF883 family membrane-anchored ribosome-binding protein
MAEAIPKEGVSRPMYEPDAAPEPIRSAAEDLSRRLQYRWEELKNRIANPTAENRPSLIQELRGDVDYIRLRARSYHEERPLQTIGMIAAATFTLGLFIGLARKK